MTSTMRSSRQLLPATAALASTFLGTARAGAFEQGASGPDRADRGAESRSEDDPRARRPFWFDGGAGYEHLDLTTANVQRVQGSTALTADLAPRRVGGLGANVGLGFRILHLTLGARLGMTFFDAAAPTGTDGSLQLYSIDAELGFRLPIGRVEPYILLGAGYSVIGGLGDAVSGLGRGLDIDGANGRLGLGIDYFVNRTLSFGVRITGEALFLARRGVPLRDLAAAQSVDTLGEAKARALEGSASSIGTAVSVTAGPGLHF